MATKICVIIPVRNEAKGLWDTLDALRTQVDGIGRPLQKDLLEVLLLINNTTDHSVRLTKIYQRRYPLFRLYADEINLAEEYAHIGTVRKLLMDQACKRLMVYGHHDGIIASTDGDTIVDNNWIWEIGKAIDEGAEAVGGRILTNRSESSFRRRYLHDVTYRCLLAQAEDLIDPVGYDPYPRHFQFFGANMAVTCQTYQHAGGLPHVSCLEDIAFYEALRLKDIRIRKSFKVKVYTSVRTDGRVQIGFSEQLKKWDFENNQGIPQLVENIEQALAIFSLRASLRKIWNAIQQKLDINDELLSIAENSGIEYSWLLRAAKDNVYFGELWHQVTLQLDCNRKNEKHYQPISEGIWLLRHFIKASAAKSSRTSLTGNAQYADIANAVTTAYRQ